MPAAVSSPARAGSAEREHNDAVDDILRDITRNGNDNAANQVTTEPTRDVDEEIKVRKKRAPVPKLDDVRLLSDAGVPKLRKIARTRVKFRGKGHEFTDISLLLNTYQLWLDDLYPRAKFRDALAMVEKLGHNKRMQITRKAWIDETKPSRKEASPERRENVEMSGALGDSDDGDGTGGELSGSNAAAAASRGHDDDDQDMPDDDELDALLHENTSKPSQPSQKQRGPFRDDTDEDDELEALMAKQQTTTTSRLTRPAKPRVPFDDDGDNQDDLDALMAEQQSTVPSKPVQPTQASDPFEDDEDELDALMTEQLVPSAAKITPRRRPFDDDDGDEDQDALDALMAEQPTRVAGTVAAGSISAVFQNGRSHGR